ncbi:MAG: C40 family peptidase [Ignavibacteria bacterium]|nr:C40 family peptidase [Ignavibacteria bacterium]
MLKNGKLLLLSVIVLTVAMITGCSATRDLSDNGSELGQKMKGANVYNNSKELVATSTLVKKSSISKSNLESLSSSLIGYVPSSSNKSEMVSDEVMYKVIEYLNTPYLWGGTSKRGIDCSAFVQTVMYQALGIMLPRTSFEQSNVGVDVTRSELKFGDLLFFDTMHKGRTTHVGIYLSDGYFVHSGSRTGVAVASLDSDFYSGVFLKAKRVVQE